MNSAGARRLITACLVAALLSPAIRNSDGLPLSTYPMFAGTRSNLTSFITASGIDESGDRQTLSPLAIAQTRDPLIAQAFLNDAARQDRAEEVCAEIAARAGSDFGRIEIASEQHDTIARLQGEDSLRSREVVAGCEVRSR